MASGAELADIIKARAVELGFEQCGICRAVPSAFRTEFETWLQQGYHGGMGYMARNTERRLDPERVMSGVKSIVVVSMSYYTGPDPVDTTGDQAVFARYARGDDYHDVMLPRLKLLIESIREASDVPFQARAYVDTGPVLEREVAVRAGLGWIGKNTMLIHPRKGSYFLLGEILLDFDLPADEPIEANCGTCTRCLDACPTNAFVGPYVLDSNRCISYLTIEHRGEIAPDLAAKMGNRVFGCDICQEVCPFNVRWPEPTVEPAFQPREAGVGRTLEELAEMTEEEFRVEFRGSPVKRAKWKGLMRNTEAVLSPSKGPGTG